MRDWVSPLRLRGLFVSFFLSTHSTDANPCISAVVTLRTVKSFGVHARTGQGNLANVRIDDIDVTQ